MKTMSKLDEIKDEVAKENSYKSWSKIWSEDLTSGQLRDKLWPMVCHRAQEEALKNARENLFKELQPDFISYYGQDFDEQLLDPSNIVK